MSTISTSEEPGARLQEALTSWATHLAPAEIQDRRYQAAFEAIDCALAATIRYMELRRAGKPQDQNHERQLTELWMEASRSLSPSPWSLLLYDEAFDGSGFRSGSRTDQSIC